MVRVDIDVDVVAATQFPDEFGADRRNTRRNRWHRAEPREAHLSIFAVSSFQFPVSSFQLRVSSSTAAAPSHPLASRQWPTAKSPVQARRFASKRLRTG